LALAVVIGGFGMLTPANAACTVNAGDCQGDCTVNTGYCGPGASCAVNTGRCVADTYQSHGGCTFNANSQAQVTQPNTYVGYLAARVTTTHADAPHAATVDCYLYVNGVAVDHLFVAGTPAGVEAGAKTTTFVAAPADVVSLCTTVTYNNGSGPVDTFCGNAITIQIPPQAVIDLLNGTLDPLLCPILASLAGTYGPITIDNTGDVTINPDPLGLNPIYDCPPYVVV
jgi:hypothetical protein